MAPKPTILIIAGAWHTPASYERLPTALRSEGYEVHVPQLPSITNTRPPVADLYADSAFIRSYATGLVEAGRSLIVLMHSYGGQVGTNALHGLSQHTRAQQCQPGGIIRLVYMCAFALPKGTSMVDLVKQFGLEEYIPRVFDFADDGSVAMRDPKLALFGEEHAKSEGNVDIEQYLTLLVGWNGKNMYDKLEHEAWRDIPSLYIFALEDAMMAMDYQRHMAGYLEKNGCVLETAELATGHCPNLTATAGVVEIINGVAASEKA